MTGPLRLFALTGLTMIAFAANSVLSRMGLAETEIGAGSFALIRLLSGAAVLALICLFQSKRIAGSLPGALALLVYAGFFSFAYIALSAGMGAIILFAMVQITMLGWGLSRGETLSGLQWTGFAIAVIALVYLVAPSVEAPPLWAAALMALAGIGWGAYSLIGRGVEDASAATTGNFILASAMAVPVFGGLLLVSPDSALPLDGVLIAIVCGGVTSGLGYVIWYEALKGLSATRAGIAQLSVPALAAIGGILFLSEPITLRFAIATTAILSGVGLAVLTRTPASRKAGQ